MSTRKDWRGLLEILNDIRLKKEAGSVHLERYEATGYQNSSSTQWHQSHPIHKAGSGQRARFSVPFDPIRKKRKRQTLKPEVSKPAVDSGTIKPCLRREDGELQAGGCSLFHDWGKQQGRKERKTPLKTLDSPGFYVSASVCEMSTKAEQCKYGCVPFSRHVTRAHGRIFFFIIFFLAKNAFEGSCPWWWNRGCHGRLQHVHTAEDSWGLWGGGLRREGKPFYLNYEKTHLCVCVCVSELARFGQLVRAGNVIISWVWLTWLHAGWGEGVGGWGGARGAAGFKVDQGWDGFPEQYGGVEIDHRSVLTFSRNGQFSPLKLDLWSLL